MVLTATGLLKANHSSLLLAIHGTCFLREKRERATSAHKRNRTSANPYLPSFSFSFFLLAIPLRRMKRVSYSSSRGPKVECALSGARVIRLTRPFEAKTIFQTDIASRVSPRRILLSVRKRINLCTLFDREKMNSEHAVSLRSIPWHRDREGNKLWMYANPPFPRYRYET